jgi:hypothetical protein
MATNTRKETKRVSLGTAREASRIRRIVVTVGPGDVIGFRLERTRKTYVVSLEGALRHAQRLEADRVRREKAQKRKK